MWVRSQPLRGALWMLGGVLAFSVLAIAARQLVREMGAFQVVFWRSAAMLCIMLAIVPRFGFAVVRTRRFGLHFLRNSIHIVGQVLWVWSIGVLTLATVFAIEFTMPIWVAILATFLLNERMTRSRIVMLALGLLGVLVIVRPGADVMHVAALVMLLTSLCYAVNMICTKRLSASDAPLGILFWMALIQTPLSLALALPGWVAPRMADAPWIFAIGASSLVAHYCVTRSFRLADASVVLPVDFVRLPLIAVVGTLAYGEPFDPMVIVGATLIFAGTYYSLSRESAR